MNSMQCIFGQADVRNVHQGTDVRRSGERRFVRHAHHVNVFDASIRKQKSVSEFKPLTRVSIYRQMKILGIKPIGEVEQHPQLYPPDTAEKILHRYGFK